MAFIKRIITDRNVVGGQRYTMTTLGDGRVEIVPSPDSVVDAGTQINADLLQRYEDFLEDLQDHVDDDSNPHAVTKSQVGLGNVPNTDATNADNIATGTLDKDRLPTDIPQANIVDLVAAMNTFNSHINNTSNPHGVTKSQVGLGSVTNDAQLKVSDKVTAISGSSTDNQIPSALAAKKYADTKLVLADLIGAISTVLTTNLTINRALVSNSSGKIAVSGITAAELNRLDGIDDNIMTLLGGKMSNGTLIGTYTNNQTINKSTINGYKFLLFELKKRTTGYNGTFYGDSKIVTPDIFYYYYQAASPKTWVGSIVGQEPFVVDETNTGVITQSQFASWLNSNRPASGYNVNDYARNMYNIGSHVYARVNQSDPAITQNGGIRLTQFDGNLTYATVASISSTQIRLNCNTTYNLRVWGFN